MFSIVTHYLAIEQYPFTYQITPRILPQHTVQIFVLLNSAAPLQLRTLNTDGAVVSPHRRARSLTLIINIPMYNTTEIIVITQSAADALDVCLCVRVCARVSRALFNVSPLHPPTPSDISCGRPRAEA